MEMLHPLLFPPPKQDAAAPVVLWYGSVNQSNSGCHTSGWKIKIHFSATCGTELCTGYINERELFLICFT